MLDSISGKLLRHRFYCAAWTMMSSSGRGSDDGNSQASRRHTRRRLRQHRQLHRGVTKYTRELEERHRGYTNIQKHSYNCPVNTTSST